MVWERYKIGVRIEAFQDPDFNIGPDEWRILDVEVSGLSFGTHKYYNCVYRESIILFVT